MSGSFDLRRLRYFIKVAELGSLTRAAEALHLAQPALSRQVRILEDEVGVALLARGPRGVTLTEAGARLLAEGRGLLDGMKHVVERVKDARDPEGDVIVGAGQSICPLLMSPLLEAVAQRLPRVRLQVRELVGGLMAELMRSGTADFCFTLNTVSGPGLRSRPVLSEEMCLVGRRSLVRPHLRRSRQGELDFRDLEGLPLYLSRRGQFVRDMVESTAKSKGIVLDLRAEVDSLQVLKELALSGAGCCVLSRASLRRERAERDLYVGRIVAPIVRRDVFLVHRRTMSRAATETLAIALEILERLVREGAWPGTLRPRSAGIAKRS